MFSDRCQVSQCLNPAAHLTCAHKCGRCRQFGHGQAECGDLAAIAALRAKGLADHFDAQKHCTVVNCSTAWSHCAASHHCRACGNGRHATRDCTLAPASPPAQSDSLTLACPYCSAESTVSVNQATAHGDGVGQCVVCLERPAQVFLSACGHINLCWICAHHIAAASAAAADQQ